MTLSTLASRIAYRYRLSTFLPERWFRDKKSEIKGILSKPLDDKDPGGITWKVHDLIIPFFQRFVDELEKKGIDYYAEVSVQDRLSTVLHVLEGIAAGYERFTKEVHSYTWPVTSVEEDVYWWVCMQVEEAVGKHMKTLESALKAIPITDRRQIDALTKRILRKATEEEIAAIEAARHDDFSASRVKWQFYDRVRLKASAKKLVKWEKITWDFTKWPMSIYELLAANYTQEALEAVDGFRQINFGDMKVIFVDPEVSIFENSWYVRRVAEAQALIRQKGFSKVWYGTFFVMSKEYKQLSPQDQAAYAEYGYKGLESQAGTYHSGSDIIKITSPSNQSLVKTIVHELGHRYWYKFMRPEQRARFNGLVKTNPSEKTRDFPSGPMEDGVEKPVSPVSDYGWSSIEEAFAEAFERYVTGRDMTRDQVESFRSVLKTAAGGSEMILRVIRRWILS